MSDKLPLPEPTALGRDYDKGWDGVDAYGYTDDQMHAHAAAAVAQALEEAAALCDDMVLYTGYDCAAAIRALALKGQG